MAVDLADNCPRQVSGRIIQASNWSCLVLSDRMHLQKTMLHNQ
jgi:hypothetical protein